MTTLNLEPYNKIDAQQNLSMKIQFAQNYIPSLQVFYTKPSLMRSCMWMMPAYLPLSSTSSWEMD